MTIGNLLPYPRFKGESSVGLALSGGKLYTYEPGTATPKATYSDYDLQTPNANPVVLDSDGEAVVYLDGFYKLKLDDSDDVNQWTMDNVGSFVTLNIVDDTTPQLGGDIDCNDFQFLESSYAQIADASLATGTHTFDYSAGDMQQLTATGNITLAATGFIASNVCSMIIDAVNFGAHTITHPAAWLFAAGTAPVYTVSGTDRLILIKDKDDIYTLIVSGQDIKAV